MPKVRLQDAEKDLGRLMDEAERGEEVVITRDDGASFKIVPIQADEPRPQFGSAEGEVWMSDDFDEPLDGFEEYVPS
jgi:antitoxin (DNA-binding transcriptional repressor) of toxin-antitoxin stability system